MQRLEQSALAEAVQSTAASAATVVRRTIRVGGVQVCCISAALPALGLCIILLQGGELNAAQCVIDNAKHGCFLLLSSGLLRLLGRSEANLIGDETGQL